jgi:GxxExxY protein
MRMELKQKGLTALSEVPLPVYYREQKIDDQGFRIDLLVEDRIIVELKSVEKVQAVHKKQLLTYLRLADKELGLLINFAGGTAEGRYSPDHQRPSERMNDLSHAEKGYISV